MLDFNRPQALLMGSYSSDHCCRYCAPLSLLLLKRGTDIDFQDELSDPVRSSGSECVASCCVVKAGLPSNYQCDAMESNLTTSILCFEQESIAHNPTPWAPTGSCFVSSARLG